MSNKTKKETIHYVPENNITQNSGPLNYQLKCLAPHHQSLDFALVVISDSQCG